MKLVEIQKKAGNKIFCFTNTKNDGFILESIKIHINKNRIIQQIDIQELKFGFCSFGLQGELLQCEAWESEEEAQSISNLSRHYTTISANDKKGYAYAKKKYRSLDKTLEDNYLRFILKDFIFQKRVLKFEEKYYTVYSQPKEAIVENNSYTSQEKEGIEILCAEALNFHLPSIKRTLLLSGFCMLVVFVLILLPFHKESKWDNMDNWPQPLEFFYFNSYEAPTSYIYRKREYSKILNTNLFPTLPLVEKTLPEAIDDYTQNLSKIENELEREVKKIYFSNNEEFFDTIYKLDKDDQVIIFHNQLVKPSGLSNFELAEALSRLYRENLTRLLYTYSDNPIVLASDYLEAQTNKDSLIRYFFFIIHNFPNTEMSIEALQILDNLFEIQLNALNALFDPLNEETCEAQKYTSMEKPLERMVCAAYTYLKTDYDKEKTKLKYDLFRESILDYALTNNKSKYRINDIRFKMMMLLLSREKNEKALENFYLITPENNYGKFLFKEKYYAVKKILQENQAYLKSLKLQSKYKKELEVKKSEIKGIENKIANLAHDVDNLTSKILSEKSDNKSIEKLREREKHLLYMER